MPILTALNLGPVGVVGAVAGLWVFIGRLVLIPDERDRIGCAVRIQELFDTRLFSLPWPDGLAGSEPSEEDIADAARRVRNDQRLTRKHAEGWYPSTDSLPWPVNVLAAQWSSLAYGRRLHGAYFWTVATTIAAAVVGAIILGVAIEMSLADWLVTFLLPGLPALLDFSEVADAHRRMAAAKNEAEIMIGQLWQSELRSPGALTADDCRRVQDGAFKLRGQDVQIPEWFYWLHRDRNEANMHDAMEARRAQYRAAGPR